MTVASSPPLDSRGKTVTVARSLPTSQPVATKFLAGAGQEVSVAHEISCVISANLHKNFRFSFASLWELRHVRVAVKGSKI